MSFSSSSPGEALFSSSNAINNSWEKGDFKFILVKKYFVLLQFFCFHSPGSQQGDPAPHHLMHNLRHMKYHKRKHLCWQKKASFPILSLHRWEKWVPESVTVSCKNTPLERDWARASLQGYGFSSEHMNDLFKYDLWLRFSYFFINMKLL